MGRLSWLITGSILLGILPLKAATRLHGRVSDPSGEAIFAATVYLIPSRQFVTLTDAEGRYELSIPHEARQDTLAVSFIGYRSVKIPLAQDTVLNVTLKEDSHLLNSIVIDECPDLSAEFSIEKLSQMDVWMLPTAAGDPLNAVSFLPASTNADESANPAFRGSRPNASQVLLNGISIVNPVRNTQINGMGNFSLFNNSLIEHLTVYAGNPPLSKSNATAGVADLTTTRRLDRSQTECALSLANVGLLRSQLLGKDPQGKNFLQAYANWQFPEPYITLNNASRLISSFRTRDFGLNLHLGKDGWEGNLYGYFVDEGFEGGAYRYSRYEKSEAANRRWFSVVNVRYSLQNLLLDLSAGADRSKGVVCSGNIGGEEAETRFQFNATAKLFPDNSFSVEAGGSFCQVKDTLSIRRPTDRYDFRQDVPLLQTDTALMSFLPELFLYGRYETAAGPVFGGGLRWRPDGSVLSWQANVRHTWLRKHTLLLAAGRYHTLSDPTLLTPAFFPMSSFQASAEYGFLGEETKLEAAVYFKKEKGSDYMEHLGRSVADEHTVCGAEISGRRDFGHIRTSLSFTCLLARIRWEGEDYPSESHLPWWFKTLVQYTGDRHLTIALSGQFRAGKRYTPIVSGLPDESGAFFHPVFGRYNAAVSDDYCRLDLTLNKVFHFGPEVQTVWFATLTNLLNRNNEAGPVYAYDYSRRTGSSFMQPRSIYFGVQVLF